MGLQDISEVLLTDSSDREAGVRRLFQRGGPTGLAGKRVVIKANFNSADPFPASSHLDTVRAIVGVLKEAGAAQIVVAERSGMGDTRENLDKLGVFALAEEAGFDVVVLDEEPRDRWLHISRGDTHWLRGFHIAKVFLEAHVVIQTCCLKTHRYGGHFTMSLKNSVGLVAKKVPGGLYDYMWELHGSPYQRKMIAEVNRFYSVDYVIMDGAKAFIDGGPDKGTEVEPGVMLAGRDRVALDAAGVALLRAHGNTSLADKPVFELEQIRRAAELGVGVGSAGAVELVPLDGPGEAAADKIRAVFAEG